MASAPINLTITADQAAQQARRFAKQMNSSRRLPPIPARLLEIAEAEKVYIFNVGPWPQMRELGSIGTWFIPGCPKGQDYIGCRPVPGLFFEPIPVDETTFEWRQEEGRYIADQIVGIGKMLNPGNSLTRYGVFVAAGQHPSKKELATAREALTSYYQELVQEARTAYATGPKEAEIVIRDTHRTAAREMNLNDEPWLVHFSPEAKQECPACTTAISGKAILCPNCKFVIKAKEYAELQARFAK